MKDKQYDPARHNEKAPEKGMAAVNTFNEGEEKTISDNKTEKENVEDKDESVPKIEE
ncbi:MAG TPA: hypothetical protein VM888_04550 [Chitinophagaceae bacterium]|jgi:hypothetical protein|nr:hypothetical protein [Chitinophagaceae bacterium]